MFYPQYTRSLSRIFVLFFYVENHTEKSDYPSNKAENDSATLETLFSKSSYEPLLVFLTKEFYHPGTKEMGWGVEGWVNYDLLAIKL